MHGGPPEDDPVSAARDVALPLVDRGGLALELTGQGADRIARFREIIAASALGQDQRTSVLGRIETDEAVARDVASAVVAVFGEDGEAVRESVSDSLDRVHDALRDGRPAGTDWQLPDGRLAAVDGEGNRASALIAAVGDAVGGDCTGAQILRFCQRVQLALMLEEEEEPIGPDYGPELE